jgi:glycosyltransferase involved in cell wall biosynthesis
MRIVMLCRHFPPAVSGGARRPYLLARALAATGHEIRVLAPTPCAGVAVVAVPHPHIDPDPRGSTGPPTPRDRLRRAVLLPDPDVRWAIRASRAKIDLAPDWVFSTSPPESAHVGGWLLRRRFGCRWVADFRDHWLDHPLRAERAGSPLRTGLERFLARRLVLRMDAALAVSESIAAEVRALGAGTVEVMENFAEPPSWRIDLPAGDIHVVHTGSFALSDPARRVGPVLDAFAAANNPRVRLHLVGRLDDEERRLVAACPAAARIAVTGPVNLETARAYQAGADALLLVTAPDTPHVPGKLAEYRAAGKPVIAFGGGTWQQAAGIVPVPDLVRAFAALPDAPPPLPPPQSPDVAARSLVKLLDSVPR